MIRFGLCCKFLEEPIRFRVATATALARRPRREALHHLADICLDNADALLASLRFCVSHGIGSFRVNSQILPLKTHPQAGYEVKNLPGGVEIISRFRECGKFARTNKLRLTFHPDQFILLSSPDESINKRSMADLRYHAEVSEWIGADVINLHGGGGYGDKPAALKRLRKSIRALPSSIRRRLTLENDDRVYTPADLLPVCHELGIPLVYDVHHHRCLPDGRSVEITTKEALSTWSREPLFHISSPINGWNNPNASHHHDFIDIRDFPACWRKLDITLEVEAKAKETAVLKLMNWHKIICRR